MASIDLLKDLLNYQITDGRYKMQVFVNETNVKPLNCIMLFYNNENTIYQIGKTVADGYYGNGIQIVCRHNSYNKGRSVAYKTLERISSNRKNYQGVYMIPEDAPIYSGVDAIKGGYTFSFNITLKGGE